MKLDYAELKDLLEKKFNESNHKEIYVQKMFVQYIIKSKNIDDYLSINKNFVDDFWENIELSQNQLYKINSKYNDEYKDLNIIELIQKIKVYIPDLYIKINDIKYAIEIKKEKLLRDNRIIFFGLDKNFELIKPNNIKEFFADTTFKVIYSAIRPYKIFIISSITKSDKKTKIFSVIHTKYTDHKSYGKIFDYLYENARFRPKILHTDFENSLTLAIKQNKNIGEKIIHTLFFFIIQIWLKIN